jgi:hypothetical protein
MRRRLFFLAQPLFEKADGDITDSAAISGGLCFYLTVKFIGDLEGCFHVAS